MKISICDVCLKDDNKQSVADYRIGFRNALKIDACKSHRYVAEVFNTASEFSNWFYNREEK